jgi:hypothetical protein
LPFESSGFRDASQTGKPMSKLARIRKLSLCDAMVLTQLVGCASGVALALKLVGWQRLSQWIIARSHGRMLRHLPVFHLSYTIGQLVGLVEMASSIFPRNRCLVRSMLMLWLLRTRGERAEVVLGVRKRAGAFEAHAWTRSEAGIIGEPPEAIASFAVMTTSGSPSTSTQL